MILHGKLVEQRVDVGQAPVWLVKQLVLARGTLPLALVRKRLAAHAAKNGTEEALDDVEADALAQPSRGVLLLVHGYGQNRYAWHLPSRSFVNHLALNGYDVFNLDLRGHGRSEHLGAPLPDRVEQFVHEDIPAALNEIHALTGEDRVFVMGHSLGGLCAYGTAALHPERVRGVISIGSPYHFTVGARVLAGLGQAFRAIDRTIGVPNLPVPAKLYGRFVKVSRRLVESRIYPVPLRGFQRDSMEREVLREHMSFAMDQASISTMRSLFRWAAEAKQSGKSELFGLAERFENLQLPLLVVAGTHDDLAPPASVRPAYERSQSPQRAYRELPFGHIDLLVGRDAPRLAWPTVTRWLDPLAAARDSAA